MWNWFKGIPVIAGTLLYAILDAVLAHEIFLDRARKTEIYPLTPEILVVTENSMLATSATCLRCFSNNVCGWQVILKIFQDKSAL